jgi:hypothetical protein
MRLYGIVTQDVEEAFRAPLSGPEIEGSRKVLLEQPKAKFSYRPLKVAYVEEQKGYVVLSVYPLKRAHRRSRL